MNAGWSAELVIDAFHQNAATACQKAGIDPHQLQGEYCLVVVAVVIVHYYLHINTITYFSAELDRQRAAGPTNDQV